MLAVIHVLNRLEIVGETLRAALNSLAVAVPDWLRVQVQPEWVERYGTRLEDRRLPPGETARRALAETIGADGWHLLATIYAPSGPIWLRQLPAVETLRRVWIQQYHASDTPEGVRWREMDDLPPASLSIHSPYDPEARFSQKRSTT